MTAVSDYDNGLSVSFATGAPAYSDHESVDLYEEHSPLFTKAISSGMSKRDVSMEDRKVTPKGTHVEAGVDRNKDGEVVGDVKVSTSYESEDKKTKVDAHAEADTEGNVSGGISISRDF